jgi:amino acid adenylation domain-containing protein
VSASAILSDLSRSGATLWAEGDELRWRGPKGALTPELRGLLAQHKPELLRLLRERQASGTTSWLPRVVPAPAERCAPFPLTAIQQAYWIGRTGAFELGNVPCQIYFEVESPSLDLARFERAWQRLVERHDMLRAVVLPDGTQHVLASVPAYRLVIRDLRGCAPGDVEEALATIRREMVERILPSDRWPLFEFRAETLPAGRVRLHGALDLLICDFWSLRVLLRDLLRFYVEPEASLPPLEISFRDYVLALETLREHPHYRRSLEYWRERLATLPPPPELPLACSPGSIARPSFVHRTWRLEAAHWRALKEQAVAAGLTASAALLAAFAEVLATWSRSPRFTLNVTLSNRLPLHPQVKDLVGDFTSITLLEVDASGRASFLDKARRIHEQLLRDLDHRFVNGVEVIRELVRARGGQHALMPVVFTGAIGGPDEGEGSILPSAALGEVVSTVTQTPQVWLDHQVYEDGGALVVNWEAVEGLFPAGVLDGMFATYGELLRALATGPERWAACTGRLVPAAEQAVQAAANATAGPEPTGLLHEAIAARAAAAPAAEAVVSGAVRLTYAEVEAQANRVGRALRARGVRPNTLVAVVMEKGWEQVVAALGVVKAGAAYLPVDPEVPAERLGYVLANGEVTVALTQRRVAERVAWPAGVEWLCVDEAAPWAPDDAGALASVQGREDLAYVIYTSGSTGQPKGVEITHRGAHNTLADMTARFGVGPGDRVLGLSSLSFDLSVYDIFGTLGAGATLVLPEAGRGRDPGHWVELLERERVTVWNSVPALMELLVECGEGRPGGIRSAVRTVWLSGDWIAVSLPARIRRVLPGAAVVSLGGATEASIWSIAYPIEAVAAEWRSIPYGRPLRNQCFAVLDEAGEPCPAWVTGELYIGGVGVARGYWRDAERTAARFVREPASGAVRYRTGDLGRYWGDGTLEFLGREDQQVKVHGYRIELGEIEAALGTHAGVREAVVAALGAERGARRLVAYVVPTEPPGPGEAELRQHLREKLPEYMVPSRFVELEALPLTANGKVDRRALPDPDAVRGERSQAYVAPRTELETQLAGVWSALLGVDRVGVEDDFIELGGDSQKAIQLLSQLHNLFQVEMPLDRFLEANTITKQAAIIEDVLIDEIAEMSEAEAEELLREA